MRSMPEPALPAQRACVPRASISWCSPVDSGILAITGGRVAYARGVARVARGTGSLTSHACVINALAQLILAWLGRATGLPETPPKSPRADLSSSQTGSGRERQPTHDGGGQSGQAQWWLTPRWDGSIDCADGFDSTLRRDVLPDRAAAPGRPARPGLHRRPPPERPGRRAPANSNHECIVASSQAKS
jgi:hypothetical protein